MPGWKLVNDRYWWWEASLFEELMACSVVGIEKQPHNNNPLHSRCLP